MKSVRYREWRDHTTSSLHHPSISWEVESRWGSLARMFSIWQIWQNHFPSFGETSYIAICQNGVKTGEGRGESRAKVCWHKKPLSRTKKKLGRWRRRCKSMRSLLLGLRWGKRTKSVQLLYFRASAPPPTSPPPPPPPLTIRGIWANLS